MTNVKNRLFALCLTVALLVGVLAVPVAATDKTVVSWTGAFGAADNNTVVTTTLPTDSQHVEQEWSSEVGNSTIVILDDKIYTYDGTNPDGGLFSDGGTFYEIDAQTGSVLQSLECRWLWRMPDILSVCL